MFTPESLFSEIIKDLSEKSSPVAVNSWAPYTRAIAIKDGNLVLVADNDMIFGFISRQWLERVNASLNELTSEHLTVTLLNGKAEEISWRAQRDDMAFGGYTFERFIVGNSNRFAHAAAYSVSQNPAMTYNPLFIYGQSGLGKTHLLYAIASEVRKKFDKLNIVYIKGDDFTNELVEAIQAGAVERFRQRYRQADLLLVDDIQFIAGKERTQEEFFHTFNSLHEAGKQIVLTADRPPKEMYTLEERLKSRFEWGLLADVQPPDLETRMALVSSKAKALGLELNIKIVEYIAESITNNVRQLEGALKKIKAMNEIMHADVTMSHVESAIRDIIKESPGLYPTPDLIMKEVCSYFNIPKEKIIGLSKTKDVAMPRQIMLYLIREMTDLSLPDIGKFSKRDHTTVLYAINKISDQLSEDPNLEATLKDIRKNIRSAT